MGLGPRFDAVLTNHGAATARALSGACAARPIGVCVDVDGARRVLPAESPDQPGFPLEVLANSLQFVPRSFEKFRHLEANVLDRILQVRAIQAEVIAPCF